MGTIIEIVTNDPKMEVHCSCRHCGTLVPRSSAATHEQRCNADNLMVGIALECQLSVIELGGLSLRLVCASLRREAATLKTDTARKLKTNTNSG